MYDLGDGLLMVASDRISTYDVVHPTPIPDKGKVLTGLSVFWFGADRRHRPQPPHLGHRGVPDERARPRAARAAAGDAAGRVRRARLHHRLGLEGLPGDRRGLRASSCPPACASPSSCPSRSSRRRPRPRSATTRRSTSTGAAELVGDRRAAERAARRVDRALRRVAEHARERGVILADTKFEFGLDADGALDARRRGAARPTPRASGRPTSYEPGRGQPSFDKQYVRDWASGTGWDKTPPAPAIPDDVVARHARALRRGLRAHRRRAVRRLAGAHRPVRARVLIRPEGGDPRSAGPGGRARAAGARVRGRVATCTSGGWSSSTSRTRAAAGDVRAAAGEPADRGLRDRRRGVRFGVVRFPGSCDEVDALLAAARASARRSCSGTRDRDLQRRRRRGRPRRLLLRRLPARRRDRPLLAGHGVGRSRSPAGRPGARHLQRLPGAVRGGLLPGALLPNTTLRFVCRQVDARGRQRRHARSRARARAGERLSIPVKHTTGRYYAPDPARRARGRRPGRAALRAGREPQRLAARHRRRVQRGGQRASA